MEAISSGNEKTLQQKLSNLGPLSFEPKANIDGLPKRIAHLAASGGGVSEIDLERLIGTNDLVKVNYLERGLAAARAVCRVYAPTDTMNVQACWGTGFMVSPALMLTNNHVIGSKEIAELSFVEFEYEADFEGRLKQGKRFRLRPDQCFISSQESELDYSLIAVEPMSEDGAVQVSKYGFLRLNPDTSKVFESEFVTIIQHPNGDQKFVALRENKVIQIGNKEDPKRDRFMWYASDTAKGSSGSPAFNDSWQVVAIHHRSVPRDRSLADGIEYQLKDGRWIDKDQAERLHADEVLYIANEGVRVSAMVADMVSQYNALAVETRNKAVLLKQLVEDALGIAAFQETIVKASLNVGSSNESFLPESSERLTTPGRNIRPTSYYAHRKGYDSDFLGVTINLPTIGAKALAHGSLVERIDGKGTRLDYTHFSLELNAERKMAFYTAVNIEGKKWRNINRGADKWYYDPRVPLEVQSADELYVNEPINERGIKNYFDRGHLVRRQDPDWGTMETAALADEDTFHWTNCSPQYWGFNQGKQLWQGLENYILYNTDAEDIKATVFSGPVFSTDDEEHRGIKIPSYFWKIVVVADSDGKIYSSGYVVSQKEYARNIPFEELPVGNFNDFQVKIAKIQKETGLEFDPIILTNDVLAANSQDSIGLRGLADVKTPRRK